MNTREIKESSALFTDEIKRLACGPNNILRPSSHTSSLFQPHAHSCSLPLHPHVCSYPLTQLESPFFNCLSHLAAFDKNSSCAQPSCNRLFLFLLFFLSFPLLSHSVVICESSPRQGCIAKYWKMKKGKKEKKEDWFSFQHAYAAQAK